MKEKYIVIDTETCNSLDDALVYDIGGCVIDNTGKVYKTFSFVIAETYIGMKDVMATAYYAEKLPKYETALRNGERKMIRIFTAKKIIRELCEKYNVKVIMAHNMRFDYNALNTTIRYFSKSKVRFFFPYGIELWDTMKMANISSCRLKTPTLRISPGMIMLPRRLPCRRPGSTFQPRVRAAIC